MAAAAGSLAIQGLTAERLVAAVPAVTLPEARKMLSGVHNRNHTLAPPAAGAALLEGVRNVSLLALHGKVHVGKLHVAAKQASAVDPFAKWVFRLADGLNVETARRMRARLRGTVAPT
jgi:23S rRNA (adenine2503-C2)-methyltransferase